MMESLEPFHLTINKPGIRRVFTESVVGLEMRLESDGLWVRASDEEHLSGFVPFDARGRGGGKATVGGRLGDDLLLWFTRASRFGPYFLLVPDGDWLKVDPYMDTGAPGRFTPHLRVWQRKSAPKPLVLDSVDPVKLQSELREVLTEASVVKTMWESRNPRSREYPPEVARALDVIKSFQSLTQEFA